MKEFLDEQGGPAVVQLQTGVCWIRARETIFCARQDEYIIRIDAGERRMYMRHCPASGLPNALGAYLWTIPHLEECPHRNHSIMFELLDLIPRENSILPPSSFRIRKPDFHDVCINIRSFISGPSKKYPDQEIMSSWEDGCRGYKTISRERLANGIRALSPPTDFYGTFGMRAASQWGVEVGIMENGINNNPPREYVDLSLDVEWGEDGTPHGINHSPFRKFPGGRRIF